MSERLNASSPASGVVNNDPAQPSIQHVGDSVTTGTIPAITDDFVLDRGPQPRPYRRPLSLWLSLLGAGTVVVGALLGVLWRYLVPLTVYQVNTDGGASTTERGLANFFAGDAIFVNIGAIAGILVGLVVWRWFAGLGWPTVVMAVLASTVMAVTCWQVGWALGPGPFLPRLATAASGSELPIELTLRSYAALLVWPFMAVLPVMMFSALAPDPEDPRAGRRRSKRTKAAA